MPTCHLHFFAGPLKQSSGPFSLKFRSCIISIMNLIESVVLGITQGVTEFIPVSSSGHLTLMQQVLGLQPDHLFLEFINVGTLLALIIFFRKKIIKIIKDVFVEKNYRLARNLLITSIPAGVIGFLLSSIISDSSFFSSTLTVAISLGVIGVVMVLIEKIPHLSAVKSGEALSAPRALSIGLAQVFALIPGVSRSGSTIIAGRISGLNSKEAAEYSFLASLPIMCGVVLKTFISSSDRAYFMDNLPTLLLSNVVAFIFGILAVSFVMRFFAQKNSLQAFGWYRIALSVVVILWLILK